ncbi:secreted immunoglobulin domain 1 isoform X2 [Pempheris klunzingeri]|uniref:secreted immunoglobulin domain 1 isoform X2 n=1 Tax=Pempheris klunzingeri TaxID=3127111 RepID=UPI00397F4666
MMMVMMMVMMVMMVSLSAGLGEQGAAAPPYPTVQVRVGEDVTLQCPLLAAPPVAPSVLSWYRQTAGRRPQLLLSFRTADPSHARYGAGVRPLKVSAAADGSLLLRGSQRSDAAVYYCGISQGGGRKDGPPPRRPAHRFHSAGSHRRGSRGQNPRHRKSPRREGNPGAGLWS